MFSKLNSIGKAALDEQSRPEFGRLWKDYAPALEERHYPIGAHFDIQLNWVAKEHTTFISSL